MATLSYTTRRQAVEQTFPLAVMVIAPLLAIFIQAYLPKIFPKFAILDLPLVVTLYFALARRSPVYGAILGASVGIWQDALTNLPLGVNGVCKTIVGYMAASVSMRLDVDNQGTRLLLVIILSFINSVLRWLLNVHQDWRWGMEALRPLLNTAIALPIFALLDMFRQRS